MSLVVNVATKHNGAVLISPNGAIDSESYAALEEKINLILKTSPKVMIFDMGKVPYISSMGINLLLQTKKTMHERGREVVMVNITPAVKKVFDVVSTLPNFTIFATTAEADNYLIKLQQREIQKDKEPGKK